MELDKLGKEELVTLKAAIEKELRERREKLMVESQSNIRAVLSAVEVKDATSLIAAAANAGYVVMLVKP